MGAFLNIIERAGPPCSRLPTPWHLSGNDRPLPLSPLHAPTQDLPRTFATHPWLRSEEGQAALRRVLTAFSVHNPGVGYCQGLNFLAALLLTATGKDEETAFWLLAALVERILYPGAAAWWWSAGRGGGGAGRGLVAACQPLGW